MDEKFPEKLMLRSGLYLVIAFALLYGLWKGEPTAFLIAVVALAGLASSA